MAGRSNNRSVQALTLPGSERWIRPIKGAIKGARRIGSIRVNFILLGLVLTCCFIGILVRQVYVDGFLEYYNRMSVTKRDLFYEMGFFDVYHTWYFVSSMIAFGASVFASSVGRLPGSLAQMRAVSPPEFSTEHSGHYNAQCESDDSAENTARIILQSWRDRGLKPGLSDENGAISILVQRNAWNRLAPYFVLAAFLVILSGMFLTTFLGLVGQMELSPGSVSNTIITTTVSREGPSRRTIRLPFELACVYMRQELIDPRGGLAPNNTLDWVTSIDVRDGARRASGDVRLNNPFDYRGYRFYQAAFRRDADASQITISFTSRHDEKPQEVTLERNSSARLADIGLVSFTGFFPDFTLRNGIPTTASAEYKNPAAQLRIATDGGAIEEVYARPGSVPDERAGESPARGSNEALGGLYRVILKDYQKASSAHTLAVDRDPGRVPIYFGFVLLVVALASMMCFSHQRVWALISRHQDGCKVYFSGDTNRQVGEFKAKFQAVTQAAIGAVRRWSK